MTQTAVRVRRAVRRKLVPFRRARLGLSDARTAQVITRVEEEHLSYLEPEALLDLADRVRRIEQSSIPGALIETGCGYGGSALVLAATKGTARPLRVYDVFGAFPAPSEIDGADAQARFREMDAGQASWPGERPFYGYVDGLLDTVRATFLRFDLDPDSTAVEFVQGLYEDTLVVDGAVALAHIDCDWYESVRCCLERIAPHLSPGGIMVFDDYDDWDGCRRAVDEFLDAHRAEFRVERRSRLHLVRRR